MKIAVIAAMSKELQLIIHLLDKPSTVSINNIVYHYGYIAGHEVVAVQSGVGKVNAAISTLTLIESFHPAIIINTGVAGGLGCTNVLDVVIPSSIGYHDVWCGPDTVRGQADGCPRLFECPLPADLVAQLGAKSGILASGDYFIFQPHEVEHVLSVYPEAVAVDMESAAIAHTCYLKDVPFVAIRVVSDTPGVEDNYACYHDFWAEAPERTFATLTQLLERL